MKHTKTEDKCNHQALLAIMDPSSRVACLEFAVGSEVSLPDLRSLYPQDWPCEMNSNYKTVKRQIDRWLARYELQIRSIADDETHASS